MHEDDVVSAIVLAIEKQARGVFNVTGPPPLPLSEIVRQAGRAPLPLPEFVWAAALGRFGLPRLPPGALQHIKFPIVCDGQAFRRATGYQHAWDEGAAIADFRRAFPPPER
jgi:UDP-glucose 4-epimerase